MEGLQQVRALAHYHPKTLSKSLHPFCYKISNEVLKNASAHLPADVCLQMLKFVLTP